MRDSAGFRPIAPDLPHSSDRPRRGPNGAFLPAGEHRKRAKNGSRVTHGLGGLRKGELAKLQAREQPLPRAVIDGRTKVAKALRALREALVDQGGGPEACTATRSLAIDLVVTDHLLLSSADARIRELGEANELLEAPARVRFVSLVRERSYLADGMMRRLLALGLEPAPRRERDLSEIVASYERRSESPQDDRSTETEGEVSGGG